MAGFGRFSEWMKHVPFLTPEDCAWFEPRLRTRRIVAKEHVLEAGSVCREIGFINTGAFRTYYLSDGKEINTRFLFEADFVVDYDSFLHSTKGRYWIQALEDAEIVTFDLLTLEAAYAHSHNWERFGRLMAERAYAETTARVENFLFHDGSERYLRMVEQQPHILERVPLYHIASYLGVERETLSRIRNKVVRKG